MAKHGAFEVMNGNRTLHLLFCRILILAIVIGIPQFAGCKKKDKASAKNQTPDSLIDSSTTDFHNVGWIGVMGQPLNQTLSFANPSDSETTVSPGGLVVREVISGSPAADVGLKSGDVIVGVGDKWLPINDDPSIDLVRLVEGRISANDDEVELRVYRDGDCQSMKIKHGLTSLDEGLPGRVQRVADGAVKGLKYLASLQKVDGSFGPDGPASALQTTAIAGLAFLASGDDQFQGNIKECKGFIAAEIDALIDAAKKDVPETKPEIESGDLMMKVAEFDMEPLTAAYVLLFLAEADIPLMDREWVERQMGIYGCLTRSQHESGGWNVTEPFVENKIDVRGTWTTNQALLAMGAFERKGISGDPEIITKACTYLKQQISARAAGNMDRRLKQSLMAGTASAWIAINCQSSDPLLQQAITAGLENVSERFESPTLSLPGVLSTAILARQLSSDHWMTYQTEVNPWLATVQLPNGSFKSVPGSNNKRLDIEPPIDNVWDTAHYCLLLGMQESNLPNMTAKTKSPMMVARNSSGEAAGDAPTDRPAGIPEGAKVMTLTLDDLSGEGSMEDQIKEKMKEMGIDTEGMEMKGLPGGAGDGADEDKDDGQ